MCKDITIAGDVTHLICWQSTLHRWWQTISLFFSTHFFSFSMIFPSKIETHSLCQWGNCKTGHNCSTEVTHDKNVKSLVVFTIETGIFIECRASFSFLFLPEISCSQLLCIRMRADFQIRWTKINNDWFNSRQVRFYLYSDDNMRMDELAYLSFWYLSRWESFQKGILAFEWRLFLYCWWYLHRCSEFHPSLIRFCPVRMANAKRVAVQNKKRTECVRATIHRHTRIHTQMHTHSLNNKVQSAAGRGKRGKRRRRRKNVQNSC